MLLKRGTGYLTESRLVESRWTFGFKDAGIITDSFYFGSDGAIKVYEGDYEKSWKIEEDILKIFDAEGNLSLAFHIAMEVEGELFMVAAHRADETGFLHVYLKEFKTQNQYRDPFALAAAARMKQIRRNPAGDFKAAVITMVYNEGRMLPLWYKYYGAQVGYENLYVIDHGSTDGSVDPKLCNQIKIPRDKFDDEQRAAMISTLHQSLLSSFDAVIYTDCDEFIVVKPTKFDSLLHYLKNRTHQVTRCVGINILPHRMDLPPLDVFRPILDQRPYGVATHWYAKPLISSVPTVWEGGFHVCDIPSYLDTNVWLFHLKFADLDYGLTRQEYMRGIEWSEDSLRLGRGGEHLSSTQHIVNSVQRLQTLEHDNIESIDLEVLFANHRESLLFRIPNEFHKAF